jgi:hypothetical protein
MDAQEIILYSKHINIYGIARKVGIFFAILGILTLPITLLTVIILKIFFTIDIDFGEKVSTYVSGFVGMYIGISGIAFIVATFYSQYVQNVKNQIENIFFKYIEMHYENINQISIKNYDRNKKGINENGRSAFITMKLQLFELLKLIEELNKNEHINMIDDVIIDFAYLIFFYGLNEEWLSFIKDQYKDINGIDERYIQMCLDGINRMKGTDKSLGNTNQTFISSYMRNLYNAIQHIDNAHFLNKLEKYNYVKILRSQLSTPELYILYFNVRSRFGSEWLKNDYVKKYQLFTNIPEGYCQKYDHKKYFSILEGFVYENDDMSVNFSNKISKSDRNDKIVP